MHEDKKIFLEFQSAILKLANNPYFRKELWIEPNLRNKKIIAILPNAIAYEDKGKLKIDYTCSDIYAKRLNIIAPEAVAFADGLYKPLRFFNRHANFATFNSDSNGNGAVQNASAGSSSWATCWGAASGNQGASTSSIRVLAAWSVGAGDFFIGRGFIPFDTSSLGSGATINSASLAMFVASAGTSPYSTTYMVLTTQAAGNALAATDYANIGTSAQSASQIDASSTGSKSINLNATGIGNINKTGYSFFGLRVNFDFNNTAPATDGSQNGDVTFNSSASASNKPTLTVTLPVVNASRFQHLTLLGVG